DQDRDHPGRQGQPAARGRGGQARGAGGGRAIPPAPDHHDHAEHPVRLPATGPGQRRGRRGARAHGHRGHWWPAGLDAADPGGDPGGLRPAGSPLRRSLPRARPPDPDHPRPGGWHRRRRRGAARMSIAQLSLRRPVTTIMLFVSMVVIGLIAATRLPLEALPDVSAPFLYVQLPYEGSTPEEVERTVLRPAEEALATMSGVKRMQGNATASGAGVFMEFSDWDRDVAIAASEARERIDAIRQELPDDFRRYFVHKWSTSDQPVLQVRLAGDQDLRWQYDLIDREFRSRLERVAGVARVEIGGAAANEVE